MPHLQSHATSGRPVLIVPGLGGSEPAHWQSHWQRALPGAARVEQADWERPELSAWLASASRTVSQTPGAILVAHSLGCVLAAHLAAQGLAASVAAALLVAPADVEADGPARRRLASFAPLPLERLPFPSTVVTSADDPYAALARSRLFARRWGADFVDLGQAGHINVAAGFGPWPEGLALLDALAGRARQAQVGAPIELVAAPRASPAPSGVWASCPL